MFFILKSGCHGLDGDDLPLVITKPGEGFDYSKIQTYQRTENVQPFAQSDDTDLLDISDLTQSTILQQIDINMNKRGFQRLPESSGELPNLLVEAFVLVTTTANSDCESSCIGLESFSDIWRQKSYSAEWTYEDLPYFTNAQAGSLLLIFSDPAQPTPIVWMGISSGLLSDDRSETEIQERAVWDIDQMFVQSPYLMREDRAQ